MENTQFSFLTSLFGGKLSGDALSNDKPLAAGESDETGGNGFFTFLEGVLTASSPAGEKQGAGESNFIAATPVGQRDIGSLEIGVNAQTIRKSLEDNTARSATLALDAQAAPDLPLADADNLQIGAARPTIPGEPIELNQIREAITSGSPQGVNAPQTSQAQTAAPAATVAAKVTTIAGEGAGAGDNVVKDGEPFFDAGGADAESRFDAPAKPALAKQAATGASVFANGASAIAEHASPEAQSHSALTREGTPAAGEFDRLSSHKVEIVANAADRNTHLNPVRDQIVAAVSARPGESKLEIRLDPPELGKVLIGFEREGTDIVRAVVSADSPETLDLMRRNADVFQRALEAQGFANLDLQFADKGPGENGDPEANDNARNYHLAEEEVAAGAHAPVNQIANGRLDRRL